MASPNEKTGFLNWLQSGHDECPDYRQQVIESDMDASEEDFAIHKEHHVASNDLPQITAEEHPNYAAYLGETNDEDMIYDQLLNWLESTICPGPEFVKDWHRIVVEGPVSTDAAMQPKDLQPEIIQFEETEEDNTGHASNSEEDNSHNDKSFSSWLLYGSDDDMEAFKDVSSESPTEGTSQSTRYTHSNDASILKPITNLCDKSSKENSTPRSRFQAHRALLRRETRKI